MSITPTIRPATAADRDALLEIWRDSVRATHHFLTADDIEALTPEVRDIALVALEVWVMEDDAGQPVGFMGLDGAKLEALFLTPSHFGRGGGRQLVEHAHRLKGPLTVDVNEQNPAALKFYKACGFQLVGRSELDSSGRPFPLLHLSDAPIATDVS